MPKDRQSRLRPTKKLAARAENGLLAKKTSSQVQHGEKWIALLIDTSTTWGRHIICGATLYAKRYTNWKLMVEARGFEERLTLPKGMKCDGVIGRVHSEKVSEYLQSLELPAINVSSIQLPGPEFPRVCNDMAGAAEMAARYFLRRGFKHFAYLSLDESLHAYCQNIDFSQTIRAKGHRCVHLGASSRNGLTPQSCMQLAEQIRSLPKPVAVFTWNASSAREVIYACKLGGMRVPNEVSVLSGADDTLFCEAWPISISAVVQATQTVGFRAAQRLDSIIQGRRTSRAPLFVPPLNIAVRDSSEKHLAEDESVVRALNTIQEGDLRNLSVVELARKVGTSRRVLERRFQEQLKTTPGEMIRRSRLDLAQKLLLASELPIALVGETAGFPNGCYFSATFTEEFGMTPSRYRQLGRPR